MALEYPKMRHKTGKLCIDRCKQGMPTIQCIFIQKAKTKKETKKQGTFSKDKTPCVPHFPEPTPFQNHHD
jgi:hypothetical protein